MKKGRHCLHLQANEEDVYRLMDTKERYFWMIGIGSLLEGIAAYFLYFRIKCWDLLYLCVILALGIILLLRQAVKISRKIMEAEVCYMELDVDSLAVCQPEKNGHYECCRIFYNEIDKIVEGTLRGVPEFYIVLNDQKEKESFFLLDEEEQNRNIFRVRSFGFDSMLQVPLYFPPVIFYVVVYIMFHNVPSNHNSFILWHFRRLDVFFALFFIIPLIF